MTQRRRCATCRKVLRGPVRGGRVYCGPECWASKPAIVDPEVDRLKADRAETAAALKRGQSPGINRLVLRRLDQMLAERSRQGSNRKKS